MRITPDGVNKVLRSLDGRGKLVSQSSKGEDLAEPIQDGDRKMAMLTGYRDQLQTLARQRALSVSGPMLSLCLFCASQGTKARSCSCSQG